MRMLRPFAVCALGALGASVGCEEGDSPAPRTTNEIDETTTEWEPSGPGGECNLDALLSEESYGSKVKTLLTGLALTDAELIQLRADPESLGPLIDGWLATPESAAMLERFFMTAFQQTSSSNASLFYLLGKKVQEFGRYKNPTTETTGLMLNRNFSESFARTMVDLIERGRPFSDAVTTDEFMMTTAQLAFLAFVDDEAVDDQQNHVVRTSTHDFDSLTFYRNENAAPPADEALDPESPNFGHFWHHELDALPPECNVVASQVVDTTQDVEGEWRLGDGSTPSFFVFATMMGRHFGIQREGSAACKTGATSKGTPLLRRSDFSDWHRVKIRRPTGSERPSAFYDLKKLRVATELVTHTERVGFFTTPGFFSTWMNNEDNSARVTMNQTLIVALGKSFEGQAVTDFSPASLDVEHAAPDSECYGCHQTLDPMRDFFRASYTNFYGQQRDPTRTALAADFVFDGVKTKGTGVRDLATILAEHPSFPYAWAQKLCYFANSAPCPEGAELDAVVAAFTASSLDFRVLVRELFSSPLVTGAKCASGKSSGTNASIARRSLFCGELSHRLGVPDICGVRVSKEDSNAVQKAIREAAASIPDDGFSRAIVEPVVITETGLFSRANTEATCVLLAENAYALVYAGDSAEVATLHMVTEVMGLSASDPRHADALTLLREHVSRATELGKTETEALQSALALACMAPGIAGVGF